MKNWSGWEVVRHQVAVAGRVLDGAGLPVSGVQMTITEMPEDFRQRVEGAASAAAEDWDELEDRLDRVCTEGDGLYYFLDLPPGQYEVKAVDQKSGAHGEGTAKVTWGSDGAIKMDVADIRLQAPKELEQE